MELSIPHSVFLSLFFRAANLQKVCPSVILCVISYRQGLFLLQRLRLHIYVCDLVDKSFSKGRILASLSCHTSKAILVSPVSYFFIHLNFGRVECNDRCEEGRSNNYTTLSNGSTWLT